MKPEPSSGSSFKTWILGILGAVITAVLIFYLEQWITKPPTQAPTHSFVYINGRVIDRTANRLLQSAIVQLRVETFNESQSTDSEGRYAFTVEDFDPQLSGSMQIEASGYKPLSLNLSLQEMSAIQDQLLDAQNPAATTGSSATQNPAAGGAKGAVVGKYMVRPDFKRISALTKH
jgi:hypothetical protein